MTRPISRRWPGVRSLGYRLLGTGEFTASCLKLRFSIRNFFRVALTFGISKASFTLGHLPSRLADVLFALSGK